jgi:hypothetical protein
MARCKRRKFTPQFKALNARRVVRGSRGGEPSAS